MICLKSRSLLYNTPAFFMLTERFLLTEYRMLIKTKFFLYSNFIIILLIVDISFGYFQKEDGKINFLKAGYESENVTNRNIIVIYDNFNTQDLINDQLIFLHSDFFTPLDQITIAFRIPIVFSSYVTTENEIADLLYANLKLKKLMDEYEKLQKNSKEMVKNVKKKTFRKDPFFLKAEINKNSYYNLNKYIHESTSKLGMIGQNIQYSTTSKAAPNPSGSFSSPAEYQRKVSLTYKPYNFKPKIDNFIDEERDSSSVKEISKPHERRTRQDHSISDLVKSINNIIQYIVDHRGESFFYFACLYFLLWFISMISRK